MKKDLHRNVFPETSRILTEACTEALDWTMNNTSSMVRWRIYHRDSEYARELRDPCVGEVFAVNKDEAERIAAGKWDLPTGAWAVEMEGGSHDEQRI